MPVGPLRTLLGHRRLNGRFVPPRAADRPLRHAPGLRACVLPILPKLDLPRAANARLAAALVRDGYGDPGCATGHSGGAPAAGAAKPPVRTGDLVRIGNQC